MTYPVARRCRCLTLLIGHQCHYEGHSPRHLGHEPTPSSAGPGPEPGADKHTPGGGRVIDTNQGNRYKPEEYI